MALLRIDTESCIGCDACVDICPCGALSLVEGVAVVSDSCNACGACLGECPVEALSLPESQEPTFDLDAYRGVWVWVEQFEGKAVDISWEMMGQGRRLADDLDTFLTACVLGHGVDGIAREAIAYGADRVFLAQDPALDTFRTEPYARILIDLVRLHRPEILLMGATSRGRDLAGSIATPLHTGLTADCTGLEIDRQQRLLVQTRPAYGGNVMATIITPNHRPQMATVRRRVFECPVPDLGRKGQIIEVPASLGPDDAMTRVIDFIASPDEVNIADASVIVSGGAGVGGPKGFEPLRELAHVLGGALGSSRSAVDAGWIPYVHQVGQTGRTVRPDLYIACGISGAIQHLAGMSTSKVIVAINNDPEAPIFGLADFGIVGDLRLVVPALTEQLRARLGKR